MRNPYVMIGIMITLAVICGMFFLTNPPPANGVVVIAGAMVVLVLAVMYNN